MLIECPECKKEISSDAKTCPQCGADIEIKKESQRALGGIGIAVLICVLLFNRCTSDDSSNTSKTSSQAAQNSTVAVEKPRSLTPQEKVLTLIGQPSIEALTHQLVGNQVSLGLSHDVAETLKAALTESNPIEDKGNYLFGSGCAKDQCGTFEAAFTIDKESFQSALVILKDGEFKSWRITSTNVPEPIQIWVQERKKLF